MLSLCLMPYFSISTFIYLFIIFQGQPYNFTYSALDQLKNSMRHKTGEKKKLFAINFLKCIFTIAAGMFIAILSKLTFFSFYFYIAVYVRLCPSTIPDLVF